MKKIILIVLLFFLVKSVFAGSIYIENSFEKEYNLEDKLILNFSIYEKQDSSGFIEVFLNCNYKNMQVYRAYHEINSNTKKYFLLNVPLLMEGICNVSIVYDSQSYFSNDNFLVSKDLDIFFELGDLTISPLDKIVLNGSIRKKSGESFIGEVLIYSDLFNKSYFIDDGKIYFEEIIKKDAIPGNYSIFAEGIFKNKDDEIINYGKKEKEFIVLSKVSDILIISNESLKPPEDFIFKVLLLDQAENIVENKSVLVKIFDFEKNIVFEESVDSGKDNYFYFRGDSFKGGWEINSYYGNVFSRKPLYVLGNEDVGVEIVDCGNEKCLRIKNTGNVFYQGLVEIELKNYSFSERLIYNASLVIGDFEDIKLNKSGFYEVYYHGDFIDTYSQDSQEYAKDSRKGSLNPTGAWFLSKVKINAYSIIASVMFIIFLILFYIAVIKNRILKK